MTLISLRKTATLLVVLYTTCASAQSERLLQKNIYDADRLQGLLPSGFSSEKEYLLPDGLRMPDSINLQVARDKITVGQIRLAESMIKKNQSHEMLRCVGDNFGMTDLDPAAIQFKISDNPGILREIKRNSNGLLGPDISLIYVPDPSPAPVPLEELIAFREGSVEHAIGPDISIGITRVGGIAAATASREFEQLYLYGGKTKKEEEEEGRAQLIDSYKMPLVPRNIACIIPKTFFERNESDGEPRESNGAYTLKDTRVKDRSWKFNRVAPSANDPNKVEVTSVDDFRLELCEGVRQADWVSVGNGTGMLLGRRFILTAAHVFKGGFPAQDVMFVFDFGYEEDGESVDLAVDASRVYSFRRVFARGQSALEDWILIELDRNVSESYIQKNLKVDLGWFPQKPGDEIYTFSHPLGSPLSFSGKEIIRSTPRRGKFYAPLDISSGSSGAPVYNSDGNFVGLVIGKESSAWQDFEIASSNGCIKYRRISSEALLVKGGHACLSLTTPSLRSTIEQHFSGDILDVSR